MAKSEKHGPRLLKVSVTFKAVVLTVERCSIDGDPVRMSKVTGDKWTGETSVVPSPDERPFRLTFRAPSHTDYEVTVKARGKNVLESSDTSDRARFTIAENFVVPLAADT
jgi:hypothetical protein